MGKNNTLIYVIIGVILLVLFYLSYGDSFIDFSKKESVQSILESPSNYLEQQLEIKGFLYQANNKVYVRDKEGYKLEIRECSKNRDLELETEQTIKGYIFTLGNEATPIFYCGVYNNSEYIERKQTIQNTIKQNEENRIKQEQQSKELAEQQAYNQQQSILTENRRKEIENSYKLKLIDIQPKQTREQIDSIDWLPPTRECHWATMTGWNLGGCTGCSACVKEETIENKFRVSIVIQYNERKEYKGNTLSVSVI